MDIISGHGLVLTGETLQCSEALNIPLNQDTDGDIKHLPDAGPRRTFNNKM